MRKGILSYFFVPKIRKKGWIEMNRRKKYKIFILCWLALDLMTMAWLGYRYLDRQIPDELQISRGETVSVSALLDHPLVSFEEAIEVSADGSYTLPCKILGYIPFKSIKVTPVDDKAVYVSGSTVGIYLRTRGVLVVDTGEIQSQSGETKEPSKGIVKPGDYILSMNEEQIKDKKELIRDLDELDGTQVQLELNREGEILPVSVTPVKDSEGAYKLGLWVRDDTQGIGTMTYVDMNGNFGALGHGISDSDTGELVDIEGGELYETQILGIEKGQTGKPGVMSGVIYYGKGTKLGEVKENTTEGIYGTVNHHFLDSIKTDAIPVGFRQDTHKGTAYIRSNVSGEVKDYEIEIQKVDYGSIQKNKGLVLRVVDEELLNLTSGIVQGMSGSPIIQDGKLIGAVTHVFINDPTRGYGIFAENMISH